MVAHGFSVVQDTSFHQNHFGGRSKSALFGKRFAVVFCGFSNPASMSLSLGLMYFSVSILDFWPKNYDMVSMEAHLMEEPPSEGFPEGVVREVGSELLSGIVTESSTGPYAHLARRISAFSSVWLSETFPVCTSPQVFSDLADNNRSAVSKRSRTDWCCSGSGWFCTPCFFGIFAVRCVRFQHSAWKLSMRAWGCGQPSESWQTGASLDRLSDFNGFVSAVRISRTAALGTDGFHATVLFGSAAAFCL